MQTVVWHQSQKWLFQWHWVFQLITTNTTGKQRKAQHTHSHYLDEPGLANALLGTVCIKSEDGKAECTQGEESSKL